MIYDHLWLGQLEPPLVLYPVPGIFKFTNAERYKLIQISKEAGADPELVAATISIESGFDPRIKNPKSTASGLFQWIKGTAMSVLKLTPEQIRSMNACAQLDLILKYYKRLAPQGIKVPGDEYVLVAASEKYLGAPDATVIYPEGSAGAEANAGWDVDKDGNVTVGEIRALVLGRAAAARQKTPIPVVPESCPAGGGTRKGAGFLPLALSAAFLGGVWYFRDEIAPRRRRRRS